MLPFTAVSHISVTVTNLDDAKAFSLRQLFIRDPAGNMIELIGPTKEPRARREGRP